MTCTNKCKNAKGDICKCSCNGENHGIYNTEEENPVERMTKLNNPNHYYLCEYSFVPYPPSEKNPKFALGADVYAHIPSKEAKKYGDRNHALAIWKDIQTKEFVVRKEFRQQSIMTFGIAGSNIAGILQTNIPNGKWEEIYRGTDFQAALDMCTIYGHKYWGHKNEWKACDHGPYQHGCCKNWKVKI